MRISRTVEISARVEGGPSVRMEQDLIIELDAREAVEAIFSEVDNDKRPGIYHLKLLLNRLAQFLKAVPEETIQSLSPDTRRIVAGFLEGTAKRFYEPPTAAVPSHPEAVKS